MATKVGDAFVEFSAKDGKLKSAIGAMKQTAAVAGAAIGAALAFGLRKSVKDAAEASRVNQRLAAVLKATGNASGFTTKELIDQASALQNVTTTGDEAIKSVQTIVATFRGISGKEFERTVENVLDLSTVLGTDAKSAAIQLGKALNDPIKGVTALGRAGVQFTEEQKAMLKKMVETNKLADAQRLILKELDMQVGGVARATRQGLGGALDGVKLDFDDTTEAIGFMIDELFSLESSAREASSTLQNLTKNITSGEFGKLFANEMRGMATAIFAGIVFPFEQAWDIVKGGISNLASIVAIWGEVWREALKGDVWEAERLIQSIGKLPGITELAAKAAERFQRRLEENDALTEQRRKEIQDAFLANEKLNDGIEDGNKKLRERNKVGRSFADVMTRAQEAVFGAAGAGGFAGLAGAPAAARAGGPVATPMSDPFLRQLEKMNRNLEKNLQRGRPILD